MVCESILGVDLVMRRPTEPRFSRSVPLEQSGRPYIETGRLADESAPGATLVTADDVEGVTAVSRSMNTGRAGRWNSRNS